MNSSSTLRSLAAAALRAALILVLFGAGWSIYRQLPGDDSATGGGQASETRLRLVLRRAANDHAPAGKINFQLYSIDVAAAQREFLSEPRRGVRLEDFVMRRMGGRSPIEGQLDERGQATLVVPAGKWWVYVTLPGALEMSWRLPLNVAGREQTIELTPDNAYARTKSF